MKRKRPSAAVEDGFDADLDAGFDDDVALPTPRRRRRTAGAATRFGDRVRNGAPLPDPGTPAKPSRMQPPEDRYGFALAALLVVVGVLFGTVHGTGSPAHPDDIAPLLGAALGFVLFAVIWLYANRFTSAGVAVVAGLLIENTQPPKSLLDLRYVMLVAPLGYAFWLTRRQSKAARELAGSRPRLTPDERRAQRDEQKARKRGEAPPPPIRATPSPNRRYTPPQPARPKRTRKEIAAEAAAEAASSKRSGAGSSRKSGSAKESPAGSDPPTQGASPATATSGSKRRSARKPD